MGVPLLRVGAPDRDGSELGTIRCSGSLCCCCWAIRFAGCIFVRHNSFGVNLEGPSRDGSLHQTLVPVICKRGFAGDSPQSKAIIPFFVELKIWEGALSGLIV